MLSTDDGQDSGANYERLLSFFSLLRKSYSAILPVPEGSPYDDLPFPRKDLLERSSSGDGSLPLRRKETLWRLSTTMKTLITMVQHHPLAKSSLAGADLAPWLDRLSQRVVDSQQAMRAKQWNVLTVDTHKPSNRRREASKLDTQEVRRLGVL